MKRTALLLTVLVALAAFSHADSISLTSGSGTLYPFGDFPGFTFQFHGSGYNISIPTALDDPGGALVNCRGGCEPLTLGGLLLTAQGRL